MGVYYDYTRLHKRNTLVVDKVIRRFVKRTMYAYDIGFSAERFDIYTVIAIRCRSFVYQDLASERLSDLSDALSDVSESDNSPHLASKLVI